MIILVTGLAGSGKTDTCYAVLYRNHLSKMVFIESDWFGAATPFDWTKKDDVESIYQKLALLIEHDQTKGYENFIISLCLPLLRYYNDFAGYLNKDTPSMLLCLKCEKDEVIRRIHNRGRHREQRQMELDAVYSDYEYLDDFIERNSAVRVINNTRITEEEVAAQIVEIIKREIKI